MNPETYRKAYLDLDVPSGGAAAGVRRCDMEGCAESGEYRAPRAPDRLGEHYWFCLEHVRAYNANWNYFQNRSSEEIDRFRREVHSWHRPTWRLGTLGGAKADPNIMDPHDILQSGLFRNAANGAATRVETRCFGAPGYPLTAEDRKALASLGLDATATEAAIKRAYKALVKRYHPDANGGNRATESKFREITDAYRHLAEAWRR